MKITLFAAMSLDGFIADKNRSEDFLSDEHWKLFCRRAQEAGAVIMGRKTYETVLGWTDGIGLQDIENVRKVIVSHNALTTQTPRTSFAQSPEEAISVLKKDGFADAILAGGSGLNASFLEDHLITHITCSIEPIVLASGVPLFQRGDTQRFTYLDSIVTDGIITLHFQVNPS